MKRITAAECRRLVKTRDQRAKDKELDNLLGHIKITAESGCTNMAPLSKLSDYEIAGLKRLGFTVETREETRRVWGTCDNCIVKIHKVSW